MQSTPRFRSTTRLDLEFSLYLVSCLALFFIVAFLGAAILAQKEHFKTSVAEATRSEELLFEFKANLPANLSPAYNNEIVTQATKFRDDLLLASKIHTTHNNELIFVAALFSIFILILFLFTSIWVQTRLFGPISDLFELSTYNNALTNLLNYKPYSVDIEIIRDLFAELVMSRVEKENQAKQLSVLERQAAVASIATQVAHDICSPLAALTILEKELATLPENIRIMVRCAINRIRDISNNLLDNKRSLEKTTVEPQSPQLIFALLEQIITEKRTQYRVHLNIEIRDRFDLNSYGIFSIVQPTEFKRLISNLVNNAVEALSQKTGYVILGLSFNGAGVQINITDNGCGIAEDILSRLMQSGETYGKMKGLGLGLYHARKTLELWNGSLGITSKIDNGTIVTVTLPKSVAANWFVEKIIVKHAMKFVVVDDDPSIHQIWKNRIECIDTNSNRTKVFDIYSPNEFKNFMQNESLRRESVLYLIDYEFLGDSENGLDLIEKNKLESTSILVTSRFEDPLIRARCELLGVKLIPKSLSGFVPIELED